jgi:multidrug efflux pump subunit AcrB
MHETMARLGVPSSVHGSFQGTARAFRTSIESQPWLILAALITVYIVLGDAERTRGLRPDEAIFEACIKRFRPIMMTTMAAMLGAVPLMVGFGEGSEMRHPLGYSIVGGLLVSQLLTLYTTPVVYLYLDRFRLWCLRLFGMRAKAEPA